MKVLFVIDSLRMGGAEKSLVTLLNLLPRENLDIDLLVSAKGGQLERMLPEGITPRVYPLHAPTALGKARLKYGQAMLRLSKQLHGTLGDGTDQFVRHVGPAIPKFHEREYDVAVAYQQGLPTYFVAHKVKARRKVAWVNADIRSMGYDLKANERLYRCFDAIVTASDILREIFIDSFPSQASKVEAVTDLVDYDYITARADSEPVPYEPEGPLRLLTVGRLHPVKGQDLAIRAAAELRDRGVDFRWYFLGEGPTFRDLVRLRDSLGLKEQVKLVGNVLNPYPWMKHCDIYVQPSRHEGYGIAIVEAKAFGRPIVVTDFPVAHTHVTPATGLISPQTPSALASAVLSAPAPYAPIMEDNDNKVKKIQSILSYEDSILS